MTVLEIIRRSTDFLADKGVESPRLQIELMLAHVLGIARLNLYLNFERVLQPAEIDAIRSFVKRRAAREPLQHILGTMSFCGSEIRVSPAVLVPRPETELLAERAWTFLRQLTHHVGQKASMLDFGTGSGCISIAVAAHAPEAEVHAVDVSADALEVARQNASVNHVTDRIRFWQSDGFRDLPADLRFDLIVSNPPYIPSDVIAALEPEVRDYDPRAALDGGADGLAFYRLLAEHARPFLRPTGRLMVEIGEGQAPAIARLLGAAGCGTNGDEPSPPCAWQVEAIERDYTGRERIMVARLAES